MATIIATTTTTAPNPTMNGVQLRSCTFEAAGEKRSLISRFYSAGKRAFGFACVRLCYSLALQSLGDSMTKNLFKLLLGVALFCGGMAIAQKPAQNINPNRHPNLAAAQRLSEQAYQ